MLRVVGKQSIGMRSTQEDCFRLILQDESHPNSDALMILCDGMGGHAGGEVASNLAADTFADFFVSNTTETRPSSRLRASLAAANKSLAAKVAKDPALRGMGCTLIGAIKVDKRLTWVSVGDSILFLLRDNKLRRLNQDHSVYGELNEMVRAGKLTQHEADTNPRRNALRSAVLGRDIPLVDVDTVELQNGDIIILATDGLESLSDREIEAILSREKRPDMRAVASDLLNAVDAKALPKQDNTTLIAYRHSGDSGRSAGSNSEWSLLEEGTRSGSISPRLLLSLILGGTMLGGLIGAFLLLNSADASFPASETESTGNSPAQDRSIADKPLQSRVIDDGEESGTQGSFVEQEDDTENTDPPPPPQDETGAPSSDLEQTPTLSLTPPDTAPQHSPTESTLSDEADQSIAPQ